MQQKHLGDGGSNNQATINPDNSLLISHYIIWGQTRFKIVTLLWPHWEIWFWSQWFGDKNPHKKSKKIKRAKLTRQWPNWEKPSSKGSCTIAFRILKVEIRVLHRGNLISVVYLTSCLILSFISTSIRPRFAHPACPLFFRLISLTQLSFLISTRVPLFTVVSSIFLFIQHCEHVAWNCENACSDTPFLAQFRYFPRQSTSVVTEM